MMKRRRGWFDVNSAPLFVVPGGKGRIWRSRPYGADNMNATGTYCWLPANPDIDMVTTPK